MTQKEANALRDLQTQEQSCIEKYTRYSKEANDTVLRDLFIELAQEEQKHYESLTDVLSGHCPLNVDCNDNKGRHYQPKATYTSGDNSVAKQTDCFLATDCIGSEKLVSSEYNSDVFIFGDTNIRKLLADIQIEEQNHAEMLWRYKTVNGMN